jgi:chromosome segregation ATPase
MTVVFTAVTLIVGLSGGYTIYRSKAAQDRASEANTKASEANAKASEANVMASLAQKLLDRAEEKAAKAQDTVSELRLEANKLDQDVHNAKRSIQELAEFAGKVQSQVEDISTNLTVIGQQAEELQRALGIFDQGDLHFLATLRLIDRYRRILLVTDDPKKRKQAEWALLEKSHADSPLIRRESVIALSGIGEPSEAVVERFEEIVAEEDDPEVKRLAEEALRNWKSTSS